MKGYVEADNPYAAEFGSAGRQLSIQGIPPDVAYAKPIFFAEAGDPATSNVTLTTDWSPRGSLRWDGGPIEIPAGVAPAPGTDGHLAIVSADRRTAWEFWRCTSIGPNGITAGVIAQWDLTGPGYSANIHDNSARGSGTPIVSTAIRADEAVNGIPHALGISVPHVSSDYVYPVATHSDGLLGASAVQYGMLFVLRPDFPVPDSAPIGERNVIDALKTYGAYVVDQGSDFELDADSTHPELWQESGLSATTLNIVASDFRLVRTTPSPVVLEGESMTRAPNTDAIRPLADPAASGGEAVSFRQSPSFATQVYTTTNEAAAVTLRMRSDVCLGAPQAIVTVDGFPSVPIDVDTAGYQDFTLPLSLLTGGAPGSHTLQVAFLNNFKTDTCDRNLYLDKVTITQDPLAPDGTAPDSPTGVSATPGDGTVSVSWGASTEPDFDHYDVYRSLTPGGPYVQANLLPLRQPHYDDLELLNGVTYHYVVRTTDAWNNVSADSAEAAATPVAPPPPPPDGYARPRGATPLRVPLVPAFQECTAATNTHGAPLAFGSCSPSPASAHLTVGTPDANGHPAGSVGFERLDAIAGDPTTPVNEADLRLSISATDVRRSSDLSPYPGTLAATNGLRITDRDPIDSEPATTDLSFSVVVPCVAPATAAGSTCNASTTANAIVPGVIQEGRRTIWALDQLKLYDGGADDDGASTADNTLFETQGVFVP